MKSYALWNRSSSINGVEANHFLTRKPFVNYTGDIILIYADEEKHIVSNIECKETLARIYNIAPTLNLDSFMEVYFSLVEPEPELDVEQESDKEE